MIEYNSITGEKTEITFKLTKCPNRKRKSRRTDEFGDLVKCEACRAYGGHQLIATPIRRSVK